MICSPSKPYLKTRKQNIKKQNLKMNPSDNPARIIAIVAVVLALLVWWVYTTTKVAVTQITNNETAVTANGNSGVITTMPATLNNGAGAQFDFTVNNNKVKADSVILVTIQSNTGATIAAVATVASVAAGSFVVRVRNFGSAALITAVKVHFQVL
jgi:hypothetical protein